MSETMEHEVRLEDYKPYGWTLNGTDLKFVLNDHETIVESNIQFVRDSTDHSDLRLDGENLELLEVSIDGRQLSNNEYSVDDEGMTLFDVPEKFSFSAKTRIHPEANTDYEGLYKSSRLFCTQCEAESFRRMTYYPDRPDVSSIFTTTIEANKEKFPNLLSNGNLIASQDLPNDRHEATWQDPFRKPCYLFALVAGNLSRLDDVFTTCSGRVVKLTIYSEPHNIDKCAWAMDCLKRAMKWDEDAYGREYDLDQFMIVAVEDFNFGAMENKGLNIFNVSALLASPDTATDGAFRGIEGVVAHEYFHNWSGNRVTCRDWFQLSLKEGFTVYRDTQFSEDTIGATDKRIETVDFLRAAQFPEDAGKLAHPVRPDRYAEISNFYTATIYEKGAEVLRMMHTMVGNEQWRKGSDLYFERHDGNAVTIEDFAASIEDASGLDLTQFFRWYVQAGTPVLTVNDQRSYGTFTLNISQSCAPSPNQETKLPFHIPVAIGMVDEAGKEILGEEGNSNGYSISLHCEMQVDNPNKDGTLILHVTESDQSIEFNGIPTNATLSFLRGFSAPVNVRYDRASDELISLVLHDTDGFSRWNASQSLYSEYIRDQSVDLSQLKTLVDDLISRLCDVDDEGEEKSVLISSLYAPSPLQVLDRFPGEDFDAMINNYDTLMSHLSSSLLRNWEKLLVQNEVENEYHVSVAAVNRRSARHLALQNIRRGSGDKHALAIARLLQDSFKAANNLTDRLASFAQLLELPVSVQEIKDQVIEEFYDRFEHEALVIDQWFRVQSCCSLPGGIDRCKKLELHSAFNLRNPNRVRQLFNAFAVRNFRNFHNSDGSGYQYIAEKVIEIEELNPMVASRLATELTQWTRFDSTRQQHMKSALSFIRDNLRSKQLLDIVTRGLVD